MRLFFICLIINIFFAGSAAAQNLELDSPSVDMDTPSVEMDMSGGGMSQDRDALLMEKNINDIDKARSELATMSQWQAPETVSSKERKEWQEQSRRLQQHADALKQLSADLRSVVDKSSSGAGNVDYEQARNQARDLVNELHNEVTARSINGDAAAKRQQAAANTLDSVSVL